MSLFYYTASGLVISYAIHLIAKRKLKPELRLNPQTPFYTSFWFILACTTPLTIGVWYARNHIEAQGYEITSAYSLINFMLEENIKGGLGFASLSLLLGVMVARFHSSKQNAERINMTLAGTTYSNAFTHRKEFKETIKINFANPLVRDSNMEVDTNKLHSYIFSEAFSGIFRSQNIDKEFLELELLERNLLYSIKDCDISEYSYLTNIQNSSFSLAEFICKHNKIIGADMFHFHFSFTESESSELSFPSMLINGSRVGFAKTIQVMERALSLRSEALESSAHFLPEIDLDYSHKILTYSNYINSLASLLGLIFNCIKPKSNTNNTLNTYDELKISFASTSNALEEGLKKAATRNQITEWNIIKLLEENREKMHNSL